MPSYRRKPQLHSLTLRARRRRRTRITIALTLLVIVAVCAAFIYLMRAPFLRVTNVEVTGADPASDQQIARYVQAQLAGWYNFFTPRNHVFEFSRLSLEPSILRAFPRLSSASVKLVTPTTISVAVSERLPKAMWCGEVPGMQRDCLLLDQNGAAYAPLATSSLAYVVYYGPLDSSHTPPQFMTPADFHALAALIDALVEKAKAGPAVSAAIDGGKNVTLIFQNGFKLIFPLMSVTNGTGILLQRFSLALQSQPFRINKITAFEYLDLRFGDSLYFKFKDSAERLAASTTSEQ